MKFGLLFRPQDPPDAKNIRRRWQEILRAAELAEDVGFDGLFVPEHHMLDDGYLPAPLIGMAAIAARTRRVDVGSTILLSPLYNPVQLAEHAAMIDVISGGRLILGCGLGNYAPEFELMGRSKSDQVALFEEGIRIMRRLWAGEELDYESDVYRFKGRIRPLPENIRLWMGAQSAPGVKRAARLGAPWPTDPLHSIQVIADWARIYRETAAEHGTLPQTSIALLRDGWVADDMDAVERDWWPCIRAEHWFYISQIPRWDEEREPFLAGVKEEKDLTFAGHHVDRLVVGDPQQCIATIRRFEQIIGNDYLIMTLRMAAGPDHGKELEAIHRFGTEVIAGYRGT